MVAISYISPISTVLTNQRLLWEKSKCATFHSKSTKTVGLGRDAQTDGQR